MPTMHNRHYKPRRVHAMQDGHLCVWRANKNGMFGNRSECILCGRNEYRQFGYENSSYCVRCGKFSPTSSIDKRGVFPSCCECKNSRIKVRISE